jgi:CBS domain-containing protein
VDRENRLCGLVALQDLKEQLSPHQAISAVIAYDLMRPAPVALTPDQRLLDVLPILLSSEQRNIPVVNNAKEKRLIGALVRAEALGVLSEAIASRSVAHA